MREASLLALMKSIFFCIVSAAAACMRVVSEPAVCAARNEMSARKARASEKANARLLTDRFSCLGMLLVRCSFRRMRRRGPRRNAHRAGHFGRGESSPMFGDAVIHAGYSG